MPGNFFIKITYMIIVNYRDTSIKEYNYLNDIENSDNVQSIDCSYNNIRVFDYSAKYSNLSYFDVSNNRLENIISLPHSPSLQFFSCYNNRLAMMPDLRYANLKILNCSDNNLLSLPTVMDLPSLEYFYCMNNQLALLSPALKFPNVKIINCANNHITLLPDCTNFPSLNILIATHNRLTVLPDITSSSLQELHCNQNAIARFPENMKCPSLVYLNCSDNELTKMPAVMDVPQIATFICDNNHIHYFPLYIMEWVHLSYIFFENNPIDMSPQIQRFLDRVQQGTPNRLNVYNDQQNTHNPCIQQSVRESINKLTTRTDIPKFNSQVLYESVIAHTELSAEDKEQLLDYMNDKTEHSLLLLTFEEVLWYVLHTIEADFEPVVQREIFGILRHELQDAVCKCFTGRLNRIVNCLNGFSEHVCIGIRDSDQIANIIYLTKRQISGDYSVEKHRTLVQKELEDRGYPQETITEWLEHILDE